MGSASIDYSILLIYLIGVTLFGVWLGKKQKDSRDYFLGGRNLPWGAVCFSIVATETSTLAFISIPGLAYITNLNVLQLAFGYLIGRIIISFTLLPAYYKGELTTAYEFLGQRFGSNLRRFASVVFQFTRLLADGVRLFATAILLAVITGWSYPMSIAVIGILTVVYTSIGGIRAVVWANVAQMVIYLGGAVIASVFLLHQLPHGWQDVVVAAGPEHKFQVFYLGLENSLQGFFSINYTFIAGILGGAFLSMASHGSDQLIVQRLLSCRRLQDSQKALITSGILIIGQFALFLTIGLMLFAYYNGQPVRSSDEIFPRFIVEALAPGLSGIIIAGIFAAAMSTLSSSLNSLASSSVLDLYKSRFGQNNSARKDLLISRIVTAAWGVVFIGGAILVKDKNNPVVELGLAIASLTYGGLLGVFLLGMIFKNVREQAALIGLWSAIFFMTWLISVQGLALYIVAILNMLAFFWIFFKAQNVREQIFLTLFLVFIVSLIRFSRPISFAWPWYVLIGCVVTFVVSLFINWGPTRR